MEFLREILGGKRKYFLLHEIASVRVPVCPELTVERILHRVKDHKEIMRYLPDLPDKGKKYIERDFLFTIVNTLDRKFFKEALAEIEANRAKKSDEFEAGLVEIEPSLFELIKSCQSRLSESRLSTSKRTMHALTSLHRRRKIPARPSAYEVQAEMRPTPKLVDDKPGIREAFFHEMS